MIDMSEPYEPYEGKGEEDYEEEYLNYIQELELNLELDEAISELDPKNCYDAQVLELLDKAIPQWPMDLIHMVGEYAQIPIKRDYRDELRGLIESINTERSSSCTGNPEFAYGGCLTNNCFPGLEVDGEPFILPLLPSQVKTMIKSCSLLHPQMDHIWQIDASRVQLKNPKFLLRLQELLWDIERKLGLENNPIECQLAQLVLEETGQQERFFSKKQDKGICGVFGTLVVFCPSYYRGGEISIHHTGYERQYQFDVDSAYDFHFVAYYDACVTKLHPLVEGYRMCLVFNLFCDSDLLPTVANDKIEHAAAMFRSWESDSSGSQGLIYLFSDRYPLTEPTIENLSGDDLRLLNVFRFVAEYYAVDSYFVTTRLLSISRDKATTVSFDSLMSLKPGKSRSGLTTLKLAFRSTDFLSSSIDFLDSDYGYFGESEYWRKGILFLARTRRWELLCPFKRCVSTLQQLVTHSDKRAAFLLDAILSRLQKESTSIKSISVVTPSLLPLIPSVPNLSLSLLSDVLNLFFLNGLSSNDIYNQINNIHNEIALFVIHIGWPYVQESLIRLFGRLQFGDKVRLLQAFLFHSPSPSSILQDLQDILRIQVRRLLYHAGSLGLRECEPVIKEAYFKILYHYPDLKKELQVTLSYLPLESRYYCYFDLFNWLIQQRLSEMKQPDTNLENNPYEVDALDYPMKKTSFLKEESDENSWVNSYVEKALDYFEKKTMDNLSSLPYPYSKGARPGVPTTMTRYYRFVFHQVLDSLYVTPETKILSRPAIQLRSISFYDQKENLVIPYMVTNPGGLNEPSEGVSNLLNDRPTTWIDWSFQDREASEIIFRFKTYSQPLLTAYKFRTANDVVSGRDPISWTVYFSESSNKDIDELPWIPIHQKYRHLPPNARHSLNQLTGLLSRPPTSQMGPSFRDVSHSSSNSSDSRGRNGSAIDRIGLIEWERVDQCDLWMEGVGWVVGTILETERERVCFHINNHKELVWRNKNDDSIAPLRTHTIRTYENRTTLGKRSHEDSIIRLSQQEGKLEKKQKN